MKIRFTESQLRHIIKESGNGLNPIANNDSNTVAEQLINDKNNEICWRCFFSATENSIFENGFSSDYFGDGEGSMYGNGVYAFYKPYGAQKRVNSTVGDKIMKCVVLGGFKDFLIFDSEIAIKYYGTDDIMFQLEYFFSDKFDKSDKDIKEMYLKKMYRNCEIAAASEKGSVMMSRNFYERSAPMARKLFSTKPGKVPGKDCSIYWKDVLASKCRGILYNGGNDPNAFVLFNPREIVPIATTSATELPSKYATDFSGWTYKVTEELVEKVERIKDFYTVGRHLIAKRLIKSYSDTPPDYDFPPEYDCFPVVLPNGKKSLYNIYEKRFISKEGFAVAFGWQYFNVFNRIVLPIKIKSINDKKTFYIAKHKQYGYIICEGVKEQGYKRVMSLDEYDANGLNTNGDKQQLNENSLPNDDVFVYHRTASKESVNGIFNNGFKKEYFKYGMYGTGIYCTLTVQTSNRIKDSYGDYMIRCKVKNGFKGFLIFNDNLAQSVYGDNHSIEDQLKRLIPGKYYDELKNKYRNNLFNDHFLKNLEGRDGIGNLGKTYVRGVITGYNGCGLIAIVRDWGALYPIDYSTDDGRTFTTNNLSGNKDEEKEYNITNLHKKIDKYPDAKFALARLISSEVIESPFDVYRNQNSLRDTQEFEEGYLLVTLNPSKKKTYFYAPKNKLISMRGFDETYGVGVEQGEILIPVIIDNKEYVIHEDDDGIFYIYEKYYKNTLKARVTVTQYDEDPNGTIEELNVH